MPRLVLIQAGVIVTFICLLILSYVSKSYLWHDEGLVVVTATSAALWVVGLTLVGVVTGAFLARIGIRMTNSDVRVIAGELIAITWLRGVLLESETMSQAGWEALIVFFLLIPVMLIASKINEGFSGQGF